jgi:hypothetical protein
MKAKHKARLVVYLNKGNLTDTQLRYLLDNWSDSLEYEGLDARCYEYMRNSDGVTVAVRFNGEDIDKVASALDLTAGDLLSQEFALGMGE